MVAPKIEVNIVKVDTRTAKLSPRGTAKFNALPSAGEVLTGIVTSATKSTGFVVVQVNHNFVDGEEKNATVIVEQKRCL